MAQKVLLSGPFFFAASGLDLNSACPVLSAVLRAMGL
jgi:hypothetical protein